MRRSWPRFALVSAAVALVGVSTGLSPAAAEDKKGTEKQLFVVAPERFHPALKEYVRHKRAALPTRLVSLEEVLRTTEGADDPERLKRFLHAAWRGKTLDYDGYIDTDGTEHAGTTAGEVFKGPPPPSPYQKGRYNATGLGEQLLRRGPDGAVAYIGCNTGSQPCGLTLLDGFAEALGKEESPRVGDCWASALRYYHDKERLTELAPNDDWYPPSIFFQGMKFMLFGDPTLPLATLPKAK